MPNSTESVSGEYLHINSCGCQHLSGLEIGSNRPNGRVDYHILYIAEGCCFVTEGDTLHSAEAGSVILFPPGTPQQYKFSADIPSVSYYIHFSGIGCSALLKRLRIANRRLIPISINESLETVFTGLIEEFQLKRPFWEEHTHAHLVHILSIIGRSALQIGPSTESKANSKLNDICRMMHKTYTSHKSIAYYARLLGTSESRFTHRFKEYIGVSPKRYILNIQISRAKELLENTDMRMAEIAESVGMADQNYFSRCFKQSVGCSPREYRANS